jgi:hypothetical protein
MRVIAILIILAVALLTTGAFAEWTDPYLRDAKFIMVDDQDFASGFVYLYNFEAEGEYRYNFYISNISNKPLDLRRAQYLGYDTEGNTYRLLFVNYCYPAGDTIKFKNEPSILNPKSLAEIECTANIHPNVFNRGLRLILRDGRTISYIPSYKKSQASIMYNWKQRMFLVSKRALKELFGQK